MKTQRIIILLLVLALIVGMEVVLMSRCTRQDTADVTEPTAEPTAPAANTALPEQTMQPIATLPPAVGVTSPPARPNNGNNNTGNTQTATATKAPTPTQAPTPAPTPAPTEPPTSGTVVASNSFSSDTGTGLNMNISWQAADQGNGTTRVYVTGKVSSYSLDVGSRSVSVSFGGYSTSVSGSSISVPEGGMQTNQLFYTYLDVPTGTDGNMTVDWAFKGSYSGTDLPTITASGYVYTD